jgi:hypothetical protein
VSSSRTTPERQRINPWKQFHGVFLPLWLLERRELSEGAKLLYAQLASLAGKRGTCWPRREWLARKFGWSLATLKRKLRELTEIPLIEIEQRGSHRTATGKSGRSARYWFVDNPWIPGASKIGGSRLSRQSGVGGSSVSRQLSPGPNVRARAAVDDSYRVGDSPRRGRGKVNGRSHAISKTNPEGQATVRGLVGGLVTKFGGTTRSRGA